MAVTLRNVEKEARLSSRAAEPHALRSGDVGGKKRSGNDHRCKKESKECIISTCSCNYVMAYHSQIIDRQETR